MQINFEILQSQSWKARLFRHLTAQLEQITFEMLHFSNVKARPFRHLTAQVNCAYGFMALGCLSSLVRAFQVRNALNKWGPSCPSPCGQPFGPNIYLGNFAVLQNCALMPSRRAPAYAVARAFSKWRCSKHTVTGPCAWLFWLSSQNFCGVPYKAYLPVSYYAHNWENIKTLINIIVIHLKKGVHWNFCCWAGAIFTQL